MSHRNDPFTVTNEIKRVHLVSVFYDSEKPQFGKNPPTLKL